MTYHEFVGHLTGGFTNNIRPLSGFPCLPKSWLSPKKIVQMGEMLLSKPTRRQFSKNRKKCRINKRKETTSLEIPKCPYINTHKNLKTSNITKMDTPSSQKKIHMYPLHFRFNWYLLISIEFIPLFARFWYIPGSAGFLPSTTWLDAWQHTYLAKATIVHLSHMPWPPNAVLVDSPVEDFVVSCPEIGKKTPETPHTQKFGQQNHPKNQTTLTWGLVFGTRKNEKNRPMKKSTKPVSSFMTGCLEVFCELHHPTVSIWISDLQRIHLHPRKLGWEWKINHLKMYLLFKYVDFVPLIAMLCHVSFLALKREKSLNLLGSCQATCCQKQKKHVAQRVMDPE